MRLTPGLICIPCFLSAFALSACSSLQSSDNFLGVITPYRVEVVQGNVITKEQFDQLKTGMPRLQVRDVLGTPLIADPFHSDRWDYVFTIRRRGTPPQDRRVVIYFENDRLKNFDGGDALPSEQEFVASIDSFKTSRNAKPLELTPEQIKELPAREATAAEAPVASASAPTRSYPPLESR